MLDLMDSAAPPPTSRRTFVRAALGAVVAGTAAPVSAPGSALGAPAPEGGPILKPLPTRRFVQHGTNAEMRWDSVAPGRHLTAPEHLFVRNHTETPRIDVATYRLAVHGDGLATPRPAEDPLTLRLRDLRRLGQVEVTSALECTGNGRGYFTTQQGQSVSGTAWRLGAVGAVTWTGVPLRRVLREIGISPDAVDVMATGLDPRYVSDGVDHGHVRRPFPVRKALEDALLAWGMNGHPLLPDHGSPLRLVLPGWVGIASIKWLGSLEVATRELTSPWNTTWYRMSGGDHPADAPPLTVNPVRSAWELAEGARLPRHAGVLLHGRAWSGAGPIERVEVSVDGGETWHDAELLGSRVPWTRFVHRWPGAAPGAHTLMARATDVRGRTQPEVTPYNTNGYFFDAVVRHPVVVA